MARWQAQAAPLKGMPIAVQHEGFPYLENWLGLKQVAVLEPKPGVAPSIGHLTEIVAQLKTTPAKVVIRAACRGPRPAGGRAGRAGGPAGAGPGAGGGAD